MGDKSTVFAVVRVSGDKREEVALAPTEADAKVHLDDYAKAHADAHELVIEEREGEHHPTWSQAPNALMRDAS